ncbi:MAG: response regulator transcription factor [Dehalococcoidia bacterium]|nr:response regulator transcription factor [Dehalococcoidia bacterium]
MTSANHRLENLGVLVVDDDPKIRRLVATHLGQSGFEIFLAANGEEAIYQASLHQPGVVVLDLDMPGIDGFETLSRLREWYTDPVIILSATDQEQDKVRALDIGADDYITKPFGTEELAARIRAASRRAERLESAANTADPIVQAGSFKIDLPARIVYREGEEVRLTRTEYDLLRSLAVNAGKVMTHRQLLQSVWGPEYGEETEYLRTFVKQLRRKLEEDPSRPKQILTEPGVGYRLFIN